MYRYEDAPLHARQHVSQRWFLTNFAPIHVPMSNDAPTEEQ